MSDHEKNMPAGENSPDYDLESILAEFKGSAYIDGDKKTPRKILDQKTQQIVFETTGHKLSSEISSDTDDLEDVLRLVGRHADAARGRGDAEQAPSAGVHEQTRQITDDSMDFFERFTYAHPRTPHHYTPVQDAQPGGSEAEISASREPEGAASETVPDSEQEADQWFYAYGAHPEKPREPAEPEARNDEPAHESADEFGDEPEDEPAYGPADETDDQEPETDFGARLAVFLTGLRRKARGLRRGRGAEEPEPDASGEEAVRPEELPEEVPEEEPDDLLPEARRFASGVHSLALRAGCAFFLSFLMLFFTFWYDRRGVFPFGLGSQFTVLAGVLTILLLLVMMLSIDVLIDGVRDLLHGEPGCESLALAASVITVICALALIGGRNASFGLPFCMIPAFSLSFALRGKRLYRTAMASSLSMAASSASKYGVVSDSGTIEDRSVLKKVAGKRSGFYRQITRADFCEQLYASAAPLLLIASLVFAALGAVKGRGFGGFLFALSAMLSVSASFTAFTAFPLPFDAITRKTKSVGGVVAGWGGASSIQKADGAIITDEDVFPIGTVSIQGYRVMEGVSESKAISCASSLIAASGSGLSKPFAEFMRGMGLAMARVEDFACYEGGVGATIRGEPVLVGTSGFMNLMSVRVPGNINTKNTLFAAMNGELAALFAINYTPANSVQGALVSLIRTRAPMIFAVKDFNVTPAMIRQKFKVPVNDIEYIPSKDCYRLSDESESERYDTSAVLFREGLGPFADVIRRGSQLCMLTKLAAGISAAGACVGVFILFVLCWLGAYTSATAFNAFFYMIVMHIPMMTLSGYIARSK